MSEDTGLRRTAAPESGLGRYASADDGALLVEVHLRRLPVQVFMASREHHDGLMREFRLLSLAAEVDGSDAPARLVELVGILGGQYARARSRRDTEMEELRARGVEAVDWVDVVPVTARQSVRQLKQLMDEADRFCEQALLVTVPRHPTVRRFGEWYLQQFEDQIAGGPGEPWDGPLHVEG